ncbi:hypothetical protein BLOT_005516, partial [Blomia tropicalis]
IYALFDWCLRRTQRLQSDRSTSSSNPTVNNTNTTDSFGNIIIERQQSIVQSIDCDRKTTITIAATNGIVQHATQLATTVHHGLTQRYGYVLDNVQTEDDIGGNCDGGGGDSCQPPFNQIVAIKYCCQIHADFGKLLFQNGKLYFFVYIILTIH